MSWEEREEETECAVSNCITRRFLSLKFLFNLISLTTTTATATTAAPMTIITFQRLPHIQFHLRSTAIIKVRVRSPIVVQWTSLNIDQKIIAIYSGRFGIGFNCHEHNSFNFTANRSRAYCNFRQTQSSAIATYTCVLQCVSVKTKWIYSFTIDSLSFNS